MGCFSWLCKECGKGIRSNSYSGEECYLFLLRDGKVIQQMEGQYNSYGACFIPGTRNNTSYEWNDPFPEKLIDGEPDPYKKSFGLTDAWCRVVDLMFDGDHSNGIAAFHKKCYRGVIPTTRSADDPNQGWGGPDEDDLMGNTDPEYKYER